MKQASGTALVLCASLFSCAANGGESGAEAIERTLILGVGGAGELELSGGSFRPGANVMLEWEAVENLLELELGASLLSARGEHQASFDLLFKKPFRLARWAELMIGLGPEVVRSFGAGKATSLGVELAVDFMFWPAQRIGFWVEPSTDVVFHDGASHGLGFTAGLLLGW